MCKKELINMSNGALILRLVHLYNMETKSAAKEARTIFEILYQRGFIDSMKYFDSFLI